MVAEHRVTGPVDEHEAHLGPRGKPRRERGSARGAGDSILRSVHDEQRFALDPTRIVAWQDPRRERDRAGNRARASREQCSAAAQGVSDEAHRQHPAENLRNLLERPEDVVHRRVLRLPASARIQKPEDRQLAAAGARDPSRNGDHPQHGQLGWADPHVLPAARAAVEHEHNATRTGRDGDGTQARLEFHVRGRIYPSCDIYTLC